MTTITVKNGKELSKTQFEDINELSEYIYDIFLERDLPPLPNLIIEKAKAAKKMIDSTESSFRPAS